MRNDADGTSSDHREALVTVSIMRLEETGNSADPAHSIPYGRSEGAVEEANDDDSEGTLSDTANLDSPVVEMDSDGMAGSAAELAAHLRRHQPTTPVPVTPHRPAAAPGIEPAESQRSDSSSVVYQTLPQKAISALPDRGAVSASVDGKMAPSEVGTPQIINRNVGFAPMPSRPQSSVTQPPPPKSLPHSQPR